MSGPGMSLCVANGLIISLKANFINPFSSDFSLGH